MNREDIIRIADEAGIVVTGEAVWKLCELVAVVERNKLAAWMIQFGFATGHGDTMEQLVDALGSEIVDRIEIEIDTEREACAKLLESRRSGANELMDATREMEAYAIRARGQE